MHLSGKCTHKGAIFYSIDFTARHETDIHSLIASCKDMWCEGKEKCGTSYFKVMAELTMQPLFGQVFLKLELHAV